MDGSLIRRHCIALGLYCALVGVNGVHAAPSPAPVRTVLILGDSLSAEYGIRRGRGWVALMEQRLAERGLRAAVVNASVSGETTAGGRTRLGTLLQQHRPALVILELGGNDALRGLPLQMTQDNLNAMAGAARAAGAKVVLVGMEVPPNYGREYAQRFSGLFAEVARAHQAALVPFLLKGVADSADSAHWFQSDRIHPNDAAQPIMLENVWPAVQAALR